MYVLILAILMPNFACMKLGNSWKHWWLKAILKVENAMLKKPQWQMKTTLGRKMECPLALKDKSSVWNCFREKDFVVVVSVIKR